MIIKPEHVGTCVAYELPRCDVVVQRVVSVYSDSICLESSDGYSESLWPSMFSSLEDLTKDYRPATVEETAAFERRFRPAPENWH